MTSRERLLTVLNGGIPDCVPVSPDTSNMIPAKLTGKPFWDIYLYNDPPIWKAYIDCVKHFGFDSLMDGYVDIETQIDGVWYNNYGAVDERWRQVIVDRSDQRIVTQYVHDDGGGAVTWQPVVTVYGRDNPPIYNVSPETLGLPPIPSHYEEVTGVKPYPRGEELLRLVKEEMGDHGLVGVFCGTSCLISNESEIYGYYDYPERYRAKRDRLLELYEKRFRALMAFECRPDFICTGCSGSLIFQTPAIFDELALPIIQRVTELCREYGIPSHIHSCGPEAYLVKTCAERTALTVIDPLEIPPMGDCNLAALKKAYGDRLVLKGNLHTTNTMLLGSPADVAAAARQAIDEAAAGGRFILSTGDQCGRDTPEENIRAMIETARTYGRYA